MTDKAYFSILFEIASHLNREFSLHAVLQKALKRTVELLDLDTGWIWLVQPDFKSVYLAASHNLPPALQNHPERLSGWCYCIQKYLSHGIAEAQNISEITCTRLKNIKTGARDLKFHATIPITANERKIGLLNLVSAESQQLNEKQLFTLNTIGNLIGMAIQRTRLQEKYESQPSDGHTALLEVMNDVLKPSLDVILLNLNDAKMFMDAGDLHHASRTLRLSLGQVKDFSGKLTHILNESANQLPPKNMHKDFHYPATLSSRELEVLQLVQRGLTNKQIAGRLFIAERTVKFHLTAIMSKLQVSTRTEAVHTALHRGLLGG